MGRKRKAGPKRKPGRPALPEGDRLSVVVSFKTTTEQAIGLRWLAEDRGISVAELVHGWTLAWLVPELQALEIRRALTNEKGKKDDE